MIEHGAFPDPGLTVVDFGTHLVNSKMLLVELRWTFRELVGFQDLATKWYDALGGGWVDG